MCIAEHKRLKGSVHLEGNVHLYSSCICNSAHFSVEGEEAGGDSGLGIVEADGRGGSAMRKNNVVDKVYCASFSFIYHKE